MNDTTLSLYSSDDGFAFSVTLNHVVAHGAAKVRGSSSNTLLISKKSILIYSINILEFYYKSVIFLINTNYAKYSVDKYDEKLIIGNLFVVITNISSPVHILTEVLLWNV